jgi:hypothetical protein
VDRDIAFAAPADRGEVTNSDSSQKTAQRQTPRIESLIAWFDRMFTDSLFARIF